MLPVAVARSSYDGSAIRYALPVLWMTSYVERMNTIRDDAYVSSSSPGGGTGGEDCRLRLHIVFNANRELREKTQISLAAVI